MYKGVIRRREMKRKNNVCFHTSFTCLNTLQMFISCTAYQQYYQGRYIACRAAKGLDCVFPVRFTQCNRVWFTFALLWSCRSSQGHGTACPSRDGLWATCPRSMKVVIRSIPISDVGGQCETKQCLSWPRKRVVAVHYKKDNLLNCWTTSSDISSYHADFHEGHSTVGAGQGRGMAYVN